MGIQTRFQAVVGQRPIVSRSAVIVLATLLVFGGVSIQVRSLAAQDFGLTIQLPTQTFFGVNTVVSVPDGGSISLGGNSGSSWGSTQRGVPGLANLTGPGRLFNNHALGGGQFASNMSVNVRVISLSEMESELLSQLPAGKSIADYARPKPVSLSIRETALAAKQPNSSFAGTNRDAGSRQFDSFGQRYADSMQPKRDDDSQSASSDANHGNILSRPVTRERVVDPNGSSETQNKADFMSRNIGRRKK